MTLKPRYLTKSLFALACKCPTKLYYTNKKDKYPNAKLEDPFLKGLAEGGLQVAALAKQYYPEGKEIKTLNYEEALEETKYYLQKEKVIIFEAAIRHQNLFIRADILVKDGDCIELIEVKAKSYKGEKFLTRKGDIYADWASYIQDIAFQTYVFQQAFPHFRIEPYLLLADKRTQCPTDGLNQKFLLKQEDSDRKVIVVTSPLTQEERSQRILAKVSVDEAIQAIFENKDRNLGKTFQETVEQFSTAYKDNQKIWSPIGKECANCEFKVTLDEEKQGCKSGFKECWSNHLNWQETDFNEPTILELWNYRKKEELIAKGVCKLSDVAEDMLDVKKDDKPGMSTSERQMQQWVQYENNVVKNPYKLLPNIFTNISEKDHILLTQEDEINNGSAALTAYAKIQSTEIDTKERTALKAGLLRYCELDTLAMVMIFEGWKNWE